MKPPHLVERLALPLAAEEEHHRQELDGAVAVQVARARLRLDGSPPPRNEVEAPEIGSLLKLSPKKFIWIFITKFSVFGFGLTDIVNYVK